MAPVTVRALESEDEVRAFMRLATAQFVGGQDLLGLQGSRPSEPAEVRWWRFLETAPHAHPGQWRGAFDGPDLRGGYTLEERSLRIGAARLRTGCVGAVVADPAHRGRGVGRAMMWDAVAQAEEREQALLLLFGVPGFYARFGYGDVADVAEHAISADRIPAQTDATIAVREATPDDAPALLELYERHDARYAGSFVRSLEHQRHQIQHRARERPLLVAVDAAANALRGSLAFAYGPWWRDPAQAHEVAADTWPATLALLQRHLSLLGGGACTGAPGVAGETGGAPSVLRWQAPPDSMVVYHLADHLPAADHHCDRAQPGVAGPPGAPGGLAPGHAAGVGAAPGGHGLRRRRPAPAGPVCGARRGVRGGLQHRGGGGRRHAGLPRVRGPALRLPARHLGGGAAGPPRPTGRAGAAERAVPSAAPLDTRSRRLLRRRS